MVSGLDILSRTKVCTRKMQAMKLYYEDELQRALSEDGSASSAYITPKAYYPGV